jgi:hypothetical protein
VEEVLVQMVNVLKHRLLPRHNNVVNGRKMLSVLWQTDTAGVRYNGNVEFGSHEEDSNDFVDTTETAGVDLANVDGS